MKSSAAAAFSICLAGLLHRLLQLLLRHVFYYRVSRHISRLGTGIGFDSHTLASQSAIIAPPFFTIWRGVMPISSLYLSLLRPSPVGLVYRLPSWRR